MNRAFLCLTAAVSAITLAACASTGEYPSLARRPAERITGTAEVAAPDRPPAPPPAPPSADTSARLAQLVEQARTAHQGFDARRANAERMVGAAGPVASDSWSAASIALGELDAAHSATMVVVAELDELYSAESVKAAETEGEAGNAAAAQAAHDEVDALVAEEDAVLARLGGRLRG